MKFVHTRREVHAISISPSRRFMAAFIVDQCEECGGCVSWGKLVIQGEAVHISHRIEFDRGGDFDYCKFRSSVSWSPKEKYVSYLDCILCIENQEAWSVKNACEIALISDDGDAIVLRDDGNVLKHNFLTGKEGELIAVNAEALLGKRARSDEISFLKKSSGEEKPCCMTLLSASGSGSRELKLDSPIVRCRWSPCGKYLMLDTHPPRSDYGNNCVRVYDAEKLEFLGVMDRLSDVTGFAISGIATMLDASHEPLLSTSDMELLTKIFGPSE